LAPREIRNEFTDLNCKQIDEKKEVIAMAAALSFRARRSVRVAILRKKQR